VAFLDADDGWRPAFLERLCAALDRAPQASASFAGWQYMAEDGHALPQVVLLSPRETASLDEDLLWRNAIVPASLVARRSAVRAAGGFDETLVSCEDWDLWIRLKAIGPFLAVPEVLAWYRTHPASKSEKVSTIEQARLKLNSKHLGSLDEPLERWPEARRRAVGFTYFNAALGYLRQGDRQRGQAKVVQAVQHWPGLLERREFYYELGCANQPRGLRGTAQAQDLAASASLLHALLFGGQLVPASSSARRYWGRACLTLASLARNSGHRRACWFYALRALPQLTGRERGEALRLLAGSLAPAALRKVARRRQAAPAVSSQ
jgi:hypothetical protein